MPDRYPAIEAHGVMGHLQALTHLAQISGAFNLDRGAVERVAATVSEVLVAFDCFPAPGGAGFCDVHQTSLAAASPPPSLSLELAWRPPTASARAAGSPASATPGTASRPPGHWPCLDHLGMRSASYGAVDALCCAGRGVRIRESAQPVLRV